MDTFDELHIKHINDHYHTLADHSKARSEMSLMQHFDGWYSISRPILSISGTCEQKMCHSYISLGFSDPLNTGGGGCLIFFTLFPESHVFYFVFFTGTMHINKHFCKRVRVSQKACLHL